jgi:serine/threonine-protein kinase HipA
MTDLFVYFQEILVGTLRKNPDATLGFQYATKWRHDAKAFALSPYLDLNETGVFDNRKTRAFFENLLPEGKVRERLEKLRGKSLSSGFQFLQEYGSDCAGALVISPKRSSPANGIQNEFTQLNLTELGVAHQNNHNLMTHVIENHGGRFSLAGAQDKIPIVYYEGQVYIPTANTLASFSIRALLALTFSRMGCTNELVRVNCIWVDWR